MKEFTIKNRKILLISIIAAALLALAGVAIGFAVAGCSSSEEESGASVTITLDKKLVALEKYESYTFDVNVSGTTDEVTWSITDGTVAKIENGTLTALKEGNAVVTAEVKGETARCQVNVSDNGLVLNIVTNVGNEKLNILAGDAFDLAYVAKYNNATVDAKISVFVSDGEIASITDGRIVGKKAGTTQIVLKAEWNGIKAVDVLDLSVVDNIVADYENGSRIDIFNDERAGKTTETLSPRIFENGERLGDGEFEVSGAEYDEKIISFDKETLVVRGLAKGVTELEIVYKSKLTNHAVASAVEVEVGLYTEDKSGSISIGNVYIDEGSFGIDPKKVFDGAETGSDGLSVLTVTDVTVTDSRVKIPVADNVVDTSSFVAGGIIGERRWEIQCEKYSYIVKANVREYDEYKCLVGEYVSAENDYKYVLKNENDERKIEIYDVSSGGIVAKGTFSVLSDGKNSGRIRVQLDSGFKGTTWIDGLYMNREPTRLSLKLDGKYVDLYSLAVGPYAKAADVYSCDNWLVDIRLNEDKTCEFDAGNNAGLNRTGTYVLRPTSLDGGTIEMTFKTAVVGVTSFSGKYSTDGHKYTFGIKANGNTYYFVQEGEIPQDDPVMTAFGGGYSSVGTKADGTSGGWISFYFGTDGTMYFDADYVDRGATTIATTGTYTLEGDKNGGKITFDIAKEYCGYKHFEGTYKFDEKSGKYTFGTYVYGSGYETIKFTQN